LAFRLIIYLHLLFLCISCNGNREIVEAKPVHGATIIHQAMYSTLMKLNGDLFNYDSSFRGQIYITLRYGVNYRHVWSGWLESDINDKDHLAYEYEVIEDERFSEIHIVRVKGLEHFGYNLFDGKEVNFDKFIASCTWLKIEEDDSSNCYIAKKIIHSYQMEIEVPARYIKDWKKIYKISEQVSEEFIRTNNL
jgi:hypothetical protein